MSDFASNFLTYLTATAFGGACLLVGFESMKETETSDQLAAAVAVPDPAPLAEAVTLPSRGQQDELQTAVLEAVVFTAAGVDSTPSFAAPSRPEGRVTGRSVNLREGPGTNYTIAGRAGSDDRLQVTGQRDGIWIEVIEPVLDRRVWIHGNFFEAPEGSTTFAQN